MTSDGYQQWYPTTPAGEAALRKSISDDPNYITGVQQRLAEMKGVPDGRCAITQKQVAFLTRVLGSL